MQRDVPGCNTIAVSGGPAERVTGAAWEREESSRDSAPSINSLGYQSRASRHSRFAQNLMRVEKRNNIAPRSMEASAVSPSGCYHFWFRSPHYDADHGCQRAVLDLSVWKIELCIAQTADARSEAEAEQVQEGEDVIGEARGVGAVLFDKEGKLIPEQN